jgi:hypothetical protein
VKTHARRGLIRLRQTLAESGVAPEGFTAAASGSSAEPPAGR